MTLLSNLPIEVLLDNLLPHLPTVDLLRLTCTNKFFATLCTDETLWKRKLLVDFNFTGEGTARTSGWKIIYRGLFKPKVFVWGENANGRLGVTKLPKRSVHGVPFPIQVEISKARIVSLVAGGTSFHALDSEGSVHVWGSLEGATLALNSDGFSEAGKEADTPLKLELPSPIRSISSGRYHSCALDHTGKVWTFVNWGRPFWFSSPNMRNPDSIPAQIQCGWNFASLLTTTGDVLVWFPFAPGPLQQIISQKNALWDADKDKKVQATEEGTIPCLPWSTDFEPTRLPPLPPLPKLSSTGKVEDKQPQIIQIAGLEDHLVALTNHGHVLKMGGLERGAATPGRWEYLPRFSDIDEIRQHESFTQECEAPETMKITHISANFRQFVAYSTGSSSIVLIGTSRTNADADPQIIPSLQNRSVISVVVGDYHNAALTADGKIFTWGSFSSGALGLGDPGDIEPGAPGGYAPSTGNRRFREPAEVKTPTQVRFNHGTKSKKARDLFCFAVTAAGWHTGALAIDLDPDSEQEELELEELDRPLGPSDAPELGSETTYESPPFMPSILRFGHAAGRGNFGIGRGGINPPYYGPQR